MYKSIILMVLFSTTVFSAANRGGKPGTIPDTSSPAPETISASGSEAFVDITTLAGSGWTFDNRSDVIGTAEWFQGNPAVFNAQAGGPNEYIAVNFNSTAASTICNWMIMPDEGTLSNLKFWTRTGTGSGFPDRLLVVKSPSGGVNTGDCVTDFGDFTETLVDINPALAVGGYPEVWTQFDLNPTGSGRIAFVYFVTDGGPVGTNSNFVGIDSVEWTEAAVVLAPPAPVPSLGLYAVFALFLSLLVLGYRKTKV